MKADLDLVVITYNSAQTLEALLKSLPASVSPIVVDNASTDETAALAIAAGAKIVKLAENIGYGSACNVGAAAGEAPFLLFINPDIRFETGAIEALFSAAEAHPDAVFNPRSYQGSRRRFRRWSRLLPKSDIWQGAPPEVDCQIPILSGSCIFIRREHFERIGGFDPKIFLFHEDDDLSLRLRQAEIQLRIASDAVVNHASGNSSIRSVNTGRIKGEAMGRSLVYVMTKHNLPLNVRAEYLHSYLKLLLPHVLLNAARRSKLLGFIRGLKQPDIDIGPAKTTQKAHDPKEDMSNAFQR